MESFGLETSGSISAGLQAVSEISVAVCWF